MDNNEKLAQINQYLEEGLYKQSKKLKFYSIIRDCNLFTFGKILEEDCTVQVFPYMIYPDDTSQGVKSILLYTDRQFILEAFKGDNLFDIEHKPKFSECTVIVPMEDIINNFYEYQLLINYDADTGECDFIITPDEIANYLI